MSSSSSLSDDPVCAGPDFITVKNPNRLPARIPAQRITIGAPGDYKPSIAQLQNGQLLVVAFACRGTSAFLGRMEEYFIAFRSNDGGLTWSPREELQGPFGREPFLTVLSDGTILMTSHLLEEDINNKDGFWYSFIHRSADEGKSWESTRIGPEGFPPKSGTVSDRKAVELLDGTVLLGVSSGRPDPRTYIWRSTDYGRTWDTSTGCDVMGWSDMDGYFSNSETFLLPSGKLLHINRVDGSNHPIEGRPFLGTKGDDNTDRSILWESTDEGVTWRNPQNFGDYGEMYPQLLRLTAGQLLYSFTVRGMSYPIGIQAIVSYDEGETWDFENDRLIVESRTPEGTASGGGYGNTIELQDGTLITCYSYRDADDKTRLEVVRWRLP